MRQSQFNRKCRWFLPWQDEKEENWLRDMANQGFHLVKLNNFGQYFFRTGEPVDTVYRLDYQSGSKKEKDAYLQLFKDSGWEYVGTQSGWQYFRKTVTSGEPDEIFTDTTSKIEKYQRQIGGMGILFPIYLVLMMNIDIEPNSAFGEVVKLIGFAFVVIFLLVFLKLAMRIDHLKKQNIKQ